LIIAVDAAADRKYAFNDLKNLVIRARNELGLEIKFQQDPETFIRPMPSKGFSRSHYVTARITDLPGKELKDRLYTQDHDGLLIYLKASMRLPLQAPSSQKEKESKAYKYKTYHPDFPHESTANQFFDEYQWEAYYQLGRFMAADLLEIKITTDKPTDGGECKINSIDELLKKFEELADKEALDEKKQEEEEEEANLMS
jgi:hypothetical protein